MSSAADADLNGISVRRLMLSLTASDPYWYRVLLKAVPRAFVSPAPFLIHLTRSYVSRASLEFIPWGIFSVPPHKDLDA